MVDFQKIVKDVSSIEFNLEILVSKIISFFSADDSDMMPVNLTERIRAELKKPFYQEKVRVMMRLYQDVLFWQFGDCGPVMGPQKFTMHNQIERLLSTIYK